MRQLWLTILAVFLAPGFSWGGPAASAPEVKRPELLVQFDDSWQFRAPVFASEVFPIQKREAVLFVGEMRLRGTVIVRLPTGGAGKTANVVVRSGKVDLTKAISVVGGQHQDATGKARWVEAKNLPSLSVSYEPQTPKELTLGQSGTCILLFEMGRLDPNEWEEGHWTVTVRFNGDGLDATVSPASVDTIPDFRNKEQALLHTVAFTAKKVRTPDDRLNMQYYVMTSAQVGREPKGIRQALAAADDILLRQPKDGPVLLEKALLLAEQGLYAEAAQVGKQLQDWSEQGVLSRRFVPPVLRGRPTPQEQLNWLRAQIEGWNHAALSAQKASPTTAAAQK